jgi:hypothetical protein
MANISASLGATGSVTLKKPDTDTQVLVTVSGTYNVQLVFEGTQDATNWVPMAVIDQGTGSVVSGASAIAPSANATYGWVVPSEGFTQIRCRVSTYTSGTIAIVMNSATYSVTPLLTNSNAGQTTAGWTLTDGSNVVVGSTTGTQIGTATTQKLAFWAATPIVQPANTTDLYTLLVNLGLIASGGTPAFSPPGMINVADAKNLVLATTTGTQVGTSTTQKLGFWGVTPVVQPTNATDLYTALVNVGIIATGGTPAFSPPGMVNIADAKNIVLATTTGTQVGTSTTQKLGFFGQTPAVQPAASTDKTTGAAGTSTGVSLDTTFKGASGSSAFTVGGIVTSLKALGLLAS